MNAFPQYNWYNASSLMIAEKIVSMNTPPYWNGQWKNADHQYLPFFLELSGGNYFGWVEFSFDTNSEKIILHKAAIAKKPAAEVKAGL